MIRIFYLIFAFLVDFSLVLSYFIYVSFYRVPRIIVFCFLILLLFDDDNVVV